MKKKAVFLGILTGGCIGASTAILLAPKSGKDFRKNILDKSAEASILLKDLALNSNKLLHSIQNLGTEGATLLKDVSGEIAESVTKWNDDMEPEKKRLKSEIKDMQKTIASLEKTLKKDRKR